MRARRHIRCKEIVWLELNTSGHPTFSSTTVHGIARVWTYWVEGQGKGRHLIWVFHSWDRHNRCQYRISHTECAGCYRRSCASLPSRSLTCPWQPPAHQPGTCGSALATAEQSRANISLYDQSLSVMVSSDHRQQHASTKLPQPIKHPAFKT
eukprot:2283193-Rhodomonas_salina.1